MPDRRLATRMFGGTRSDAYHRGRLLTVLGFLVVMLSRLAGVTGGWAATAVLIGASLIVVFGLMELWNWRSLTDEPPSTL
ncbi:MAG: hypothetical protein JNK12_11830 [Acidimicrobiales bacterium]|nr:hypothetical protein [Acidimicrobiales bacterium]